MATSLIVLYAPTGAGKTTLRLRLEQQLITEALPELAKDTARVPLLAVEAIAPESGQFHWKDYYARAAQVALNEPLLDRKIAVNGGDRARAHALCRESLPIAKEVDDRWALHHVLAGLGDLATDESGARLPCVCTALPRSLARAANRRCFQGGSSPSGGYHRL